MKQIFRLLRSVINDRMGVTIVEYALLAGLIGGALVGNPYIRYIFISQLSMPFVQITYVLDCVQVGAKNPTTCLSAP